jgi:hypothetical protein
MVSTLVGKTYLFNLLNFEFFTPLSHLAANLSDILQTPFARQFQKGKKRSHLLHELRAFTHLSFEFSTCYKIRATKFLSMYSQNHRTSRTHLKPLTLWFPRIKPAENKKLDTLRPPLKMPKDEVK